MSRKRAHNQCVRTRGLNRPFSDAILAVLELHDTLDMDPVGVSEQREPKSFRCPKCWLKLPTRIFPNMRRSGKYRGKKFTRMRALVQTETSCTHTVSCGNDVNEIVTIVHQKPDPQKNCVHSIFACRFTLTCGFRVDLCLITICCKSLFSVSFAFHHIDYGAAHFHSHAVQFGSVRFETIHVGYKILL